MPQLLLLLLPPLRSIHPSNASELRRLNNDNDNTVAPKDHTSRRDKVTSSDVVFFFFVSVFVFSARGPLGAIRRSGRIFRPPFALEQRNSPNRILFVSVVAVVYVEVGVGVGVVAVAKRPAEMSFPSSLQLSLRSARPSGAAAAASAAGCSLVRSLSRRLFLLPASSDKWLTVFCSPSSGLTRRDGRSFNVEDIVS